MSKQTGGLLTFTAGEALILKLSNLFEPGYSPSYVNIFPICLEVSSNDTIKYLWLFSVKYGVEYSMFLVGKSKKTSVSLKPILTL